MEEGGEEEAAGALGGGRRGGLSEGIVMRRGANEADAGRNERAEEEEEGTG